MTARRPVGVLTHVGRDVDALARAIRSDVIDEVRSAGAGVDFRFAEPTHDIERFIAAVQTGDHAIVQLVSHAGADGRMAVADVWGSLALAEANLARMLRGAGVRLVLVTTCHGARIARALVDGGAVDAAVGVELPLTFSAARGFSRGFYRSLARGRTLGQAFADGQAQAAARDGAAVERLQLVLKSPAVGEQAVCAPPDFYLVGTPSPARAGTVEALRAALSPRRLFHVGDLRFGDLCGETLASRLEQARIIMVVFEGERVEDAEVLEQVATAVDELQHRPVRVFPLYLSGTRPSRHVPYGLRRLTPAFLADPRFGGDVTKLAAELVALLD